MTNGRQYSWTKVMLSVNRIKVYGEVVILETGRNNNRKYFEILLDFFFKKTFSQSGIRFQLRFIILMWVKKGLNEVWWSVEVFHQKSTKVLSYTSALRCNQFLEVKLTRLRDSEVGWNNLTTTMQRKKKQKWRRNSGRFEWTVKSSVNISGLSVRAVCFFDIDRRTLPPTFWLPIGKILICFKCQKNSPLLSKLDAINEHTI